MTSKYGFTNASGEPDDLDLGLLNAFRRYNTVITDILVDFCNSQSGNGRNIGVSIPEEPKPRQDKTKRCFHRWSMYGCGISDVSMEADFVRGLFFKTKNIAVEIVILCARSMTDDDMRNLPYPLGEVLHRHTGLSVRVMQGGSDGEPFVSKRFG